MPPTTAGYVLVGGRSSRFGSDKALVPWQGRPLAARVAEHVRLATGSVTLVGAREKYAALGLPIIEDQVAGFGPLAGLAAALNHTAADWNIVVACDMPHASVGFLRHLLQIAVAENPDVLLPLDRKGRAEPLCAVYSIRCRKTIAGAVGRGIHKMTDAFAGLRVRELAFAEYATFDRDGRLFANLNTPADLAETRAAG